MQPHSNGEYNHLCGSRVIESARARGLEATDDAGLVEAALAAGDLDESIVVEGVPGEAANVKVTRPEDLPEGAPSFRVGLGHDLHPLVSGRAFVLAGVDIQQGAGP